MIHIKISEQLRGPIALGLFCNQDGMGSFLYVNMKYFIKDYNPLVSIKNDKNKQVL